MKTLRQLRTPRSAIPFFEGLLRNLSRDQQLRKLPALCFALDWHRIGPSEAQHNLRARPPGWGRCQMEEVADSPTSPYGEDDGVYLSRVSTTPLKCVH
jgi:hypothetical protein